MIKETIIGSILAAFMAIAGSEALAANERGTPAEAKALLQKAVAHYKSVGRKQALADFMAQKSAFIDRDLYVVCIDANHVIAANGAFPTYVGAHTNPVGEAIWHLGMTKGEGSVEYPMINPVSHKVELKIGFVKKAGDDVCLVGAYRAQ